MALIDKFVMIISSRAKKLNIFASNNGPIAPPRIIDKQIIISFVSTDWSDVNRFFCEKARHATTGAKNHFKKLFFMILVDSFIS